MRHGDRRQVLLNRGPLWSPVRAGRRVLLSAVPAWSARWRGLPVVCPCPLPRGLPDVACQDCILGWWPVSMSVSLVCVTVASLRLYLIMLSVSLSPHFVCITIASPCLRLYHYRVTLSVSLSRHFVCLTIASLCLCHYLLTLSVSPQCVHHLVDASSFSPTYSDVAVESLTTSRTHAHARARTHTHSSPLRF